MAVQSTLIDIGDSLTYPSTKAIATKQHMAVWLRELDTTTWVQLGVTRYDLINNAAVIKSSADLLDKDVLELRVADNPNELGYSQSDIAIVAGNIDSIIICATNIDTIIAVAENQENIDIVALNIDDIIICANDIDAIKDAPNQASAAASSANDAQLYMWSSQAEAMTSDSYANEPENVLVKNWTSDGDGTFTPTDIPNTYSSLHWSIKSGMAAIGLTFQDVWDASTGVYPTTRPPEGTGSPLEEGDLFIISVTGSIDGTVHYVGDWIILNPTLNWVRVPSVVDWDAIIGVPDNVIKAVPNEGRVTGLDLNTLFTTQVIGLADDAINIPSTRASWGALFVQQSNDVTTQICTSAESSDRFPRMWIRVYRTGEWGPWAQMGTMTWDGTTLDITL